MAIAIGLLKMLLELQESRKTGALDVIGPAARVRLFVEEGNVVHADEGTVGETLGRILVREQVLDHEQYTAAIEWMTDLRAAGKRALLGEVFVDLGLLTQQQLYAALSAQVQSRALRALGWPSARFRFIETEGPLVLAERFVTPIEPLIVAALRLADRERIESLLAQTRDRYVALRADETADEATKALGTAARIDAFRFQPAEDSLVRGLDGTRTVGELLDVKDTRGVDRPVILAALLLTEQLDLHAAAGTRSRTGPPSLIPRSIPPRSSVSSRPHGADPAQAGPDTRGTVAPLSDREPRDDQAEPAVRMAPLLAEKTYQSGKRLLRANRLAEAVVELRRAASLYRAVEYDLWATWAEARADEKDEDAHADALRAVAELAIEEDTERGFATFILGHLARRRGDNRMADTLFERARALDPEAIEDPWEARLRMGSAASETRSEVKALAPLLTTPSTPVVGGGGGEEEEKEEEKEEEREEEKEEEKEEGSGVTTLRGLAAMEALKAERRREEARSAGARGTAGAGGSGSEGEGESEGADAKENAHAKEDANAEDANAEDANAEDANAKAKEGERASEDASSKEEGKEAGREGGPGRAREKGRRGEGGRKKGAEAEAVPQVEGGGAGRGWGLALAIVAGIGVAVFVATRGSAPTPEVAPLASSGAPLPSGSATFIAAASAPRVAPEPPPAASASASADNDAGRALYVPAEGGVPQVDGGRGVLVLPSAADTHRVYVDGRLAGIPPLPIVVGCGRHVVKVGSQGREQVVVVPCGGSVPIAYP